jgi:hypothetical protein
MRGIVTGMDRPTIIDVARLAGVSKKTVSQVINKSPPRPASSPIPRRGHWR